MNTNECTECDRITPRPSRIYHSCPDPEAIIETDAEFNDVLETLRSLGLITVVEDPTDPGQSLVTLVDIDDEGEVEYR